MRSPVALLEGSAEALYEILIEAIGLVLFISWDSFESWDDDVLRDLDALGDEEVPGQLVGGIAVGDEDFHLLVVGERQNHPRESLSGVLAEGPMRDDQVGLLGVVDDPEIAFFSDDFDLGFVSDEDFRFRRAREEGSQQVS